MSFHLIWPHRAVRVLHCNCGESNKLYIVRVDLMPDGKYHLVGSYGKATASHLTDSVKATSQSLAMAKAAMLKLADAQVHNQLYQEITNKFNMGVTIEEALKKIDATRIVVVTDTGRTESVTHTHQSPPKIGRGARRVKRDLMF